MSWIVHFELSCDVEDCGNMTDGGFSKGEAREDAKKAGWVRRDGKDLCPDHAS